MRAAILALCAVALTPAAGWSQAAPYDAVVQKPMAEIRGGRSAIFPVTGVLRQGQSVRVLREEAGWLAIAPPLGSSSWVLERVLDPQPRPGQRTICVVRGDNVPVLLGTADNPLPQPNQVATLKEGTQLYVVGEKATSDALGEKATWWRIQPAPSEVRWISRDAITAGGVTTVQSNVPTNMLWQQAEAFERYGQFNQAIAIYRQIAGQRGVNPDLAVRAYNRAEGLSRRAAGSGTTTAARPVATTPPADPTGTRPWPAGVQMTSGPGVLRRAAFLIDGNTAFVLEDARGYPRVYVIAQSGLNLEPFINRHVELFGPMVNKPELATRGYMAVNKLYVLR